MQKIWTEQLLLAEYLGIRLLGKPGSECTVPTDTKGLSQFSGLWELKIHGSWFKRVLNTEWFSPAKLETKNKAWETQKTGSCWDHTGPHTHRKTRSFQLLQVWKQQDYALKELPSNMYKSSRRGPKKPFTNTHLPPRLHEVDKKPCLKGHKVSGSFTNNTREKQQVEL